MDLSTLVDRQRQYFSTGATLPVEERLAVLRRLYRAIGEREGEICHALRADLGKSPSESFLCEIGMTLSELSHLMKHLPRWAKPRRHKTGLVHFPARSTTRYEPYGVVLVMSPWNYPFLLTLGPLMGAVAAGNCCVVKPSAYSPATSAVLASLLEEVFPRGWVDVVTGGREENAALLEQRFDYIFFTGGGSVGRLVLEKAAAHLTPVSLELGGKSPCIIEKTADLKVAASRVAFGKWLNCGQTCVAPDYVLVDRQVKEEFLARLKQAVPAMYGRAPLDNPDYGRIVNEKHFHRLVGLMEGEDIFLGGETDREGLKIAPTVLDQVSPHAPVMGEEIFGPLLPVLTYDSLEEAMALIRSREKPLALYLFTRDREVERKVLTGLSFGGGCVNDTIIHLATSEMPFGGVGASGMGSYHGFKSFETFSHEKSVVKKANWLDLPLRYQPYKPLYLAVARRFMK